MHAFEILDFIGSAYRGHSLSRRIPVGAARAGTSGNFLKTNGTGADPAWRSPAVVATCQAHIRVCRRSRSLTSF
jgi:hypothetical protein